jgi:GT2 family glycosyltransferase
LLSPRSDFSSKRNLGLQSAKYDLVAFLDADCIATPQWPALLLPKIASLNVAAVACNAYPPPDAPFLGKCFACLGKPAGGAIGFDSEVQFIKSGVNYVGSGCTLYRKSHIQNVGGFDESLCFGNEDVDLSQRLRSAGYVLEYAADAFVYHKTRNTMKQFIRWAYRRGMSHYYSTKPSFAQILLEPFSLLWLFIFIVVILMMPARYLLCFIIATPILFIVFTYQLVAGAFKSIFPSGSRKLRLLIERRRRIGVGLVTIMMLILPLFCIDRFILNLAQLHSSLFSPRAKSILPQSGLKAIAHDRSRIAFSPSDRRES